MSRGEIDAWDYQWQACTWYLGGGLTAIPNTNLVTNIGFGPEATHTKCVAPSRIVAASPLGPLQHPNEVCRNVEADQFTFDHCYGGATIRQRQRPLGYLWWLISGSFRVTKRKFRALFAS